MHKIVQFSLAAALSGAITSSIWFLNWPSPPPKPAPALALSDVRGLVNYLKPVAHDYTYGGRIPADGMTAAYQNSRVQVCANADDTVSITVDTGYQEHMSGVGGSLHEAEMDLGKKSAAIAGLMN